MVIAVCRVAPAHAIPDRDEDGDSSVWDSRNDLVKAQGFPALNKADVTSPTCIFTVTVCSSPKLIVVMSFEDCRMKVTRSGLT
jgi:hypothetical protein